MGKSEEAEEERQVERLGLHRDIRGGRLRKIPRDVPVGRRCSVRDQQVTGRQLRLVIYGTQLLQERLLTVKTHEEGKGTEQSKGLKNFPRTSRTNARSVTSPIIVATAPAHQKHA